MHEIEALFDRITKMESRIGKARALIFPELREKVLQRLDAEDVLFRARIDERWAQEGLEENAEAREKLDHLTFAAVPQRHWLVDLLNFGDDLMLHLEEQQSFLGAVYPETKKGRGSPAAFQSQSSLRGL